MGPLTGQPYAQGVTKSYGWGAGTAQGRYADVYCFAWALTKRQDFLDAVSQYADYSLGLNPLGKSFVTGLGSDQVNSPLHLDSWFTKYGEGAHAGSPKGNVPGIVIFGPSEGRSDTPYQRAISDLRYPVWENLPGQRRWADGWALVNNNEFSVWETMVWNLCMYAFLAGV
jgi:endoglucanase